MQNDYHKSQNKDKSDTSPSFVAYKYFCFLGFFFYISQAIVTPVAIMKSLIFLLIFIIGMANLHHF